MLKSDFFCGKYDNCANAPPPLYYLLYGGQRGQSIFSGIFTSDSSAAASLRVYTLC